MFGMLFGQPKAGGGGGGGAPHSAPKPASSAVPEGLIQDTSSKLQKQLDIYGKQINHLEKQETQMLLDIKAKMLKGDKQGAMHLFRKKKLLEKQRLQASAYAQNLESITGALSNAKMQKQQVDAIELGLRAVSAVKETVNVDHVHEMVEELDEVMGELNEAADVLAQPLAGGVNDAEFEDEFAALQAEAFGDVAAVGGAAAAAAAPPAYIAPSLPAVPSGLPLPAVPRGVPQAAAGGRVLTMEEELAALEAAA